MANLAFQSILATGHREMGEFQGPERKSVYDVFFENIDLPGFVESPALVVLATKHVDHEWNFITINAPPEVSQQNYNEVRNAGYFVWRVLRNPTDSWILQVHQIEARQLKAAGNVLGIHSRDVHGENEGVHDDFSLARLFIFYSSSE